MKAHLTAVAIGFFLGGFSATVLNDQSTMTANKASTPAVECFESIDLGSVQVRRRTVLEATRVDTGEVGIADMTIEELVQRLSLVKVECKK